MRPKFYALTITAVTLALPVPGAAAKQATLCDSEPNVERAAAWWTETRNVWTPVGWKNHLFRFNVLFSGTILAEPHPQSPFAKKHTSPYAGLGVQLEIIPSASGAIPPLRNEPYPLMDSNGNRVGRQGWATNETPVLWTEWRQPHFSLNGVTLKSEIFGHIPGGGDVKSGIEPLFGWIRISVAEKLEMIPRDKVGFLLKVNAPHTQPSMWALDNLVMQPALSSYPRKLVAEMTGEAINPGCVLVEETGLTRLAVVPGRASEIVFTDRPPAGKDYYLYVTLPAVKGAYVDVLLPYVPVTREILIKEMGMGRDRCLAESDEYWAHRPATAAAIHTPEPLVNALFRMTPKIAELNAERNPETGQYAALCGSFTYASVWATPQSMIMHMLLDPLGYHDVSARYLRIYKETQGTSKAPGPSFSKHPGYLSAPRSLSSVDWITDHGAILHAIAKHALLTRDQEFISNYSETIVRACEFIQQARLATNHQGALGVLPPASATDRDVPEQGLWSDGWNYKGLTTAARLLRAIHHPRADDFTREAESYKTAFRKALARRMQDSLSWQDASGKSHRLVPSAFINGDDNHPFYLDTGPLFLVFSGLMKAQEEPMRESLLYFREGPNARTFDPFGNFHQPAMLHHEISSCEPCYSWNIYHSWQTGDRSRFLEGMYSLITGGMSRQTFASSEHRGGISGTQFVAPLAVDLMRLSVIDDQFETGNLHLLRLTPLAWVATEQARFENMPTEFGPVTARWHLNARSYTLHVEFSGKWRTQPDRITLHTPPVPGLRKVIVNGKSYSVPKNRQITLSSRVVRQAHHSAQERSADAAG